MYNMTWEFSKIHKVVAIAMLVLQEVQVKLHIQFHVCACYIIYTI